MNKKALIAIIVISVVCNLLLLQQNLAYKDVEATNITNSEDNCLFPDSSYLVDYGEKMVDLRGFYSYPSFGRYIIPPRENDPTKAPFSLVVFLAAKTVGDKENCIPCLDEFKVYKRLDSLFKTRNQNLLFFTEQSDSAAVADYLIKQNMTNELLVAPPDSGLSLYQLGISYRSMPFKIAFDSNFTAIYMRGANSYLPAQLEFERTMTFLSDISVGEFKN